MSWADLRTNLNLNISNFTQGLQAASAQTAAFSASLSNRLNMAVVDPTKKAKMEFKDVGRIVQGIIVSKMFYGTLNAIRNCTRATIEFANSLEYSEMMYTNLFGNKQLAEELLEVLKQFSATTPFSFKDSQEATKRLLAYGIQAKNVMFIMNGIMAAASASGDSSKIESLSRALGQIYTKGRLMNEEMRQLAEAGVPAYQILKEELGLTQKQLQNLGKEAIPASIAINALVNGITKRYQGVVDDSTKTVTGMMSNIKDIASIIANEAIAHPMARVRGFITRVSEALNEMYEVVSKRGVGGLFEHLIPENMQEPLRQFIALSQRLAHDIGVAFKSIFRIIGSLMPTILMYLNSFKAIMGPIVTAIANLLDAISRCPAVLKALQVALAMAAAGFVLFKLNALRAMVAQALVGVVNLLTRALASLSTMLTFVMAHPVVAILMAITGAVVFATGAVDGFGKKVKSLINGLNDLQGTSTKNVLLPEVKETEAPLDKFNKQLDTTNDQLGKVDKNARKARQGLLSFDEVFKITGSDGSAGETPDLSAVLPEIPEFNPESWTPKIDVGKKFTDDLFTGIINSIKKHISDFGKRLKNGFKNLGIGGIIVTAIAAAIMAFCATTVPYGIFAALATVLTTALIADWSDDIHGNGKNIAAAIGGALGFVIGGFLGGPKAAIFGASIGGLASYFWSDFRTNIGKFGRTASNGIAAAIGAVLGTMLLGPGIGTAVGALGGAIASDIIGAISSGFSKTDSKHAFFDGLGGLIGAAIGFVAGGPIGMAIGGLAGALVASLVQDICTNTSSREAVQSVVRATTDLYKETTDKVNETLANVGQGVEEAAKQYGSLRMMVDDLYELLSKDNLTEAQKTGIVALVDALNEKLPSLDLSYNAVTGEISKQKDEVQALIDKTEAYYMLIAAKDDIQNEYNALYDLRKAFKAEKENFSTLKEIADADEQAWIKAKNAYDAAAKSFSNPFDFTGIVAQTKLKPFKDALNDAKSKLDESSEALQLSQSCLDDYSTKMGEVRKSIQDTTEDITVYNDELNGTSNAAKQAYIDMSTAVGQMGGLFANGTPVLKEEANKIYKAIQEGLYPNNGEGYVDTANNIVYTFGNAVFNKIDYVNGTVGEMTRQANQTMLDTADGTDAGKKAADTFAGGVKLGRTNVISAFTNLGIDGKQALRNQLYNFDQFGLMCTQGLTNGLKKGTPDVTAATKTFGNNIQTTFQNTMAIRSPSRVFAYFGRMITAGTTKGIEDGSSKTEQSVSSLGKRITNAMNKLVKPSGSNVTSSFISEWLDGAYNRVANWSGAVQQLIDGTFNRKLATPSLAGAGSLSIPMPNGSVGMLDTAQYQSYMANNNNVSGINSTQGVDNIAKQVIEVIAPMLANNTASSAASDLPPMYVGTLIADERGLKELNRKLRVISAKEERRS